MKEQLKSYLEAAFSGAPNTTRNQELKEEVLANIYEKYDDFVASGMSSEDAYRATINSIGDLSALFEDDAAKEPKQNTEESFTKVQDEFVPLYDEKTFTKKKMWHDMGLACSIMLYIFSVIPVILFEGELFAVVGMFLIIAAATGIIVYLENTKQILVSSSLTEKQKNEFCHKRMLSAIVLACSVMGYILCVCPVILFEEIGLVGMFLMIGVSTAAIILRGTLLGTEKIKQKPMETGTNNASSEMKQGSENTNEPKPHDTREKNARTSPAKIIFSILSGIFWALVCLVYFAYSFLTSEWQISWLIFVYAAFFWAIVHGVFSLIIGRHRVGSVIKIVICSILLFALLTPAILGSMYGDFSFGFETAYIYDDSRYEWGNVEIEPDSTLKSLNIHWIEGDVTVAYWDGATISVFETYEGYLDRPDQLHYFYEDNTLDIQYFASRALLFGNNSLPEKHLTVYLPRATELNYLSINGVSADLFLEEIAAKQAELGTVSGKITLENCTVRDLDLDTVSGTIRVSGSAQEIDADSVSGDFTFYLITAPQQIGIDSVSSNVKLTLPTDIAGFTVDCDSTGYTDFPEDGTFRNDEYVWGDGSTEIEIDLVSGNLTVELGAVAPVIPKEN